MAICLVTGGAGFIGSHLVEALVHRGDAVRVLDDLSTGSLANLDQVQDRIEFLHADITDPQALAAAVEGADLVFHQAALPSVPESWNDPSATHHACATGTLLLLLAARQARVRRVVYAGSHRVYGNAPKLPKVETDPLCPASPYAVAKVAGECYCEIFTLVHGLETVRLRYFNVYGPRQRTDAGDASIVPRFLGAMLQSRRPLIYGDGTQTRDFTYVDDVVQANLLAAQARRVAGKVYNIAFGRQTSLLELADHVNGLLGTDLKPIHVPGCADDVQHTLANTSLAQTDLGFCPCIDVREGVRRCLAHLRSGWGSETEAAVPEVEFRPHALGLKNGRMVGNLP
jgi:UDP-glucose 4-epimerase